MHFSTASAVPGDRASLETQWLYPKSGVQCLQFFLHNSGASDDVLNVWVREYDGAHGGRRRLFRTITGTRVDRCQVFPNQGKHKMVWFVSAGGVRGSWELHTITLNITKKARVVFEGIRGVGPSAGGLSLDDINLSSAKCPQHVWHLRNITGLLAATPAGRKAYSPRFLSPAGYSFQVNALSQLKPKPLLSEGLLSETQMVGGEFNLLIWCNSR